jgi:hypothetical protein
VAHGHASMDADSMANAAGWTGVGSLCNVDNAMNANAPADAFAQVDGGSGTDMGGVTPSGC